MPRKKYTESDLTKEEIEKLERDDVIITDKVIKAVIDARDNRTKAEMEAKSKESKTDKHKERMQDTINSFLEDKEILSISDDNDDLLIYIGKNFEGLNLESKIKVLLHLRQFIDNQKEGLIKLIEDI